ncbi:MAG: hypothetical protein ACXQS7_01795 [Candidatus Syntropharchaeia archaeon]
MKEKKFIECKYCGASVRIQNYLEHLKKVHSEELTDEDREAIEVEEVFENLSKLEDTQKKKEKKETGIKLLPETRKTLKILKKKGTDKQKEFVSKIMDLYELYRDFYPVDIGTIENNAWYPIITEFIEALNDIEINIGFKTIKGIEDGIWKELVEKRLEFIHDLLKKEFEKINESNEDYYYLKDEIETTKRAIEVVKGRSCTRLMEEMMKYLEDGVIEPRNPEKEFKDALEINPRNYIALKNLSWFYQREGRDEEALEIKEKLISYYPQDLGTRILLAENFMKRNNYDRVIELCEEGMKIADEYPSETGKPWEDYEPPETFRDLIRDARKLKYYSSFKKSKREDEIKQLIKKLYETDDKKKFPDDENGYKIRKDAMRDVINSFVEIGEEVVPYLVEVMFDVMSWASIFIPEILKDIGGDLSTRALVDGLTLDSDFIIEECIEYISENIGEPAIPYLREIIYGDYNLDCKENAILCLGKMSGVEKAYDLLVELLKSEDEAMVNSAGISLGIYGKKEALPLIIEAKERIGGERPLIDWAIKELESLEDEITDQRI